MPRRRNLQPPPNVIMFCKRLVLLGLAITSSGCYRYVPADLDGIAFGSEVQARLSREGLERLRSRAGIESPGFGEGGIDGRLLERAGEHVLLSVPWATVGDVYSSAVLNQRIDLTRADIVEIRHKQLDRRKTGALVGAFALATGAILVHVLTGETGGKTTLPPTGGPPEWRGPALVGHR